MAIASTEQLIHATTSLCAHCKNALPARVVANPQNEVWMHKSCPEHGAQAVRLSNNADWYAQTLTLYPARPAPPARLQQAVEHGCPFDCGPCANHSQKVRLPVVTINSDCNLKCPICYVHNKDDDPFRMQPEEFSQILAHLVADHGGELDLINFTGGEPTLHPHFLTFIAMAKAAGIHRVSVCSNGIRLAQDEALVQQLAQLGGRVALSFDTFEKATDVQMQGANLLALKLRCLALLEKYQVATTLIPVMTLGVNDNEIGKIIELGLSLSNVRHIEIHTITFTGQGGVSFPRSGRISMYEVLQRIEQTTGGLLTPQDFVPSPCAHPLCYQIAYLLIDPEGGPPIPFSRFMPTADLYQALADRLYLEPGPALEAALRSALDRLWVEDGPDAARILRLLKALLQNMFPDGGQREREAALRVGEQSVKAIYIHSHMDEETFDTARAAQCCDSNCYADGRTIPVCNYNVLYREKEAHFNPQAQPWQQRLGGQKVFALHVQESPA